MFTIIITLHITIVYSQHSSPLHVTVAVSLHQEIDGYSATCRLNYRSYKDLSHGKSAVPFCPCCR